MTLPRRVSNLTGSFSSDALVLYTWEYRTGNNDWSTVEDTLVIGSDSVFTTGLETLL